MKPASVNDAVGSFVIQKLREKYSEDKNLLSKSDQEKLEKNFYSKPSNRVLRIGCYVIPGIIISIIIHSY